MRKKVNKFIKALLIILLVGISIELFLGGKRLYDYKRTYSLEKKITYLSDPWCFSYGFPQKNITVLKNNNVKVKNNKDLLDGDENALILSTKHFKFYLSHGVAWDVYNKTNKKNMILDYSGNYCYSNDINTDGPLVNKKTVKLMKKELNNKMDEIGHKLNYQIYNPF